MNIIVKPIILLAISSIAIVSCKKKEIALDKVESDNVDAAFGVSLVEATFNLGRSTEKEQFIKINPTTGLLEYVYPKRLFDLGMDDLYTPINPSTSVTITLPPGSEVAFNAGGAGTPASFSDTITEFFTFSNGELMDSIIVKNGTLDLNLSSTFTHDGEIDILIPSLVKNGIPFTATVPFDYIATVPVVVNASLDISDYKLDLTMGGTTNNSAQFIMEIELINSGTGVIGTESIDFSIGFNIDTVQGAYGYLGNIASITTQDTATIDFFSTVIDGSLHIAEPRIELDVYNMIGIDIQANFNNLSAPDNTNITNIAGPGLTAIPLFSGPTVAGDTILTQHIIDNSNTSPTIADLLDEAPERIIYDASSIINPNNVQENFITCESRIWCDSRLILPLDGWFNDFIFSDTSKFEVKDLVGDTADIESLKSATIRLIMDNGLPLESNVQVYFADTNNNILDSLFTSANGQNIVPSAIVNTSGVVTSSVKKVSDITLTKNQLINLSNTGAEVLMIKATANTTDANSMQDVKFFPSYNLRVKVSAKVNVEYNLSSN